MQEICNKLASIAIILNAFAVNRSGHLIVNDNPCCIADGVFYDKTQKELVISQFCICDGETFTKLSYKAEELDSIGMSFDLNDDGDCLITVLPHFIDQDKFAWPLELKFRRHRTKK